MNEILFQYVIYWTPSLEESQRGEKSKILVGPKTILAAKHKDAKNIADNDIPEAYLDNLSQINIVVRPF